MDKIFFSEPLPKLILDGKKSSTWRIDEDVPRKSNTENTAVGDIVSLCYNSTDEEFAKAEVIEVIEKSLIDLNEEDMDGHEKYSSVDELYRQFSGYYNIVVNRNTRIKVIKFKLVITSR